MGSTGHRVRRLIARGPYSVHHACILSLYDTIFLCLSDCMFVCYSCMLCFYTYTVHYTKRFIKQVPDFDLGSTFCEMQKKKNLRLFQFLCKFRVKHSLFWQTTINYLILLKLFALILYLYLNKLLCFITLYIFCTALTIIHLLKTFYADFFFSLSLSSQHAKDLNLSPDGT